MRIQGQTNIFYQKSTLLTFLFNKRPIFIIAIDKRFVHLNFPEFSFQVTLTIGSKAVVRYLHVRRQNKPNQDEHVNIFDEVAIMSVSKHNTSFFYLGSVTHELNQGSIVNYFLVRSVVDFKPQPGHWVEYKVKSFPISKVRMTCS